MNVLFICRANVGRSQMADSFFKKYSKKNYSTSAGTLVFEDEGKTVGENEEARFLLEAMDKEGIDLRKNKRTQLTPELIKTADKIIIMAKSQFCPDYLLKNKKVIFWDIIDGKGADFETHIKIRNEIKNKILELVNEIG